MPLKRNQPARSTPSANRTPSPLPSPTPSAGSVAESQSPAVGDSPVSSTSSLDRKLQAVLKNLRSNPEVAYVLASVKKGLANAGTLSDEEKQRLLLEVQRALEQSPSILQALREYRG